ncbi:MAG: hypothetical protein LH472_14950 [Pyrinomonadaceae bacterium]|nr:hypothetical protein [Pyrinomonadaceae bacterium]
MKKSAVLFLIILLSAAAFAQKPRPRVPRKNNLTAKNLVKEKESLETAIALTGAAERIAALQKFGADFPKSPDKNRVLELVVSGRAALGDEKLQANEIESGIELLKLAVSDAPKPVSDKLFTEVLIQIPNSLFLRGQTKAAIETARLVEEKADGNAKQTLAVAGFYLGLENAAEAKRLAEKSLALEANLPAAYQTLGLAERINFALEDSANAYQKALELDPNSTVSKRSLAEMKRAVGKPAEAVALYREILANDETDSAARTGLILALFDEENKTEAESEMQQSLEANPNNLPLLVGAAYWYAAHNDGAKAVELAEKAVAVEPRYTWAHIALARGLTAQKRPLDAEKTLLTARNYGNFPTLEYELAAVRMQTGFYREAAEGLAKSFTIKDGLIETKLGGRVSKEAKSFIELLSLERRASIFEPLAADNPESADKLKALLDFYQKLETAPNDEAIIAKADEFIRGDDKMKLHRQLFAANILLNKKSHLPKVLELTKLAVGGVDAGLSVPNPAAAVLAEELYENRQLAMSRGKIILVPEVSRQTLSNILRGRIEDLAGWALFQEGKPAEAVVRLKRAVSILPDRSSWWRDSQWRLGAALESNEKLPDALDAYVKSYTNGEPSAVKYHVVQAVYQRINGNTDGLESKIGAKPASITAEIPVQTAPPVAPETVTETVKTEPTPEIISNSVKAFPPSPITVTKPATADVPNEVTPVKTEPAPTSETKIETPKVEETIPETETKVEESTPQTEIKKDASAPTAETKPVEIAPDEIKAEVKSAAEIEIKPAPKETEAVNTPTAEPAEKPLFEPVIITVPKAEIKPLKKSSDENGASRPRVVASTEAAPIAPCKIRVNQEIASIIGDGGNLALITELDGDGEVKEIKATSSSPADVEAVFDSEIGGQTKRALFVIKSISPKKGIFTITFEMVCGKKEVLVSVR